MLPVIFVTSNEEAVQRYIDDLKQSYKLHPSCVYIIKQEKKLTIEPIREVLASTSTYTYQTYLVVIYGFDSASIVIQNSLLKTLEEESSHVQFVLVVQEESGVLPTIRSRAHIVYDKARKVLPLKSAAYHYTSLTLPEWMSMTSKISKDKSGLIIDSIIHDLRVAMLEGSNQEEYTKALHTILQLRRNMRAFNLNPEHVLDQIGHIVTSQHLL